MSEEQHSSNKKFYFYVFNAHSPARLCKSLPSTHVMLDSIKPSIIEEDTLNDVGTFKLINNTQQQAQYIFKYSEQTGASKLKKDL